MGMLWTTKVPYRVFVRWNDLFGDLEGQFASAVSQEFAVEVAELTIAERASVELAARLRVVGSDPVIVHLAGGSVLRGEISDVTPTWILLREGRREHLVPLAAVVGVVGVPNRSLPWGEVERRLTLGHALRVLADAGARVVVETQGSEFRGVVAAVGADYCDVLLDSGSDRVSVPFTALRRVTST
jgi:sRNA-binding regulator protein Hfq